jgi:hypothetical protein
MIANYKEKTGKTLEEWIKIAGAKKFAKHGEVVAFLKSEHDMGHGYANMVAHKLFASDAGSSEGDDLVAAMFADKKAGLKPIYDKLVAALQKMGSDIELAPKKTYVSVRRATQFAILQPSTATRFDVGIQLKGAKPTGRLEASGSFNSMVSHRVRVDSPADINAELIDWLKQAYTAAG